MVSAVLLNSMNCARIDPNPEWMNAMASLMACVLWLHHPFSDYRQTISDNQSKLWDKNIPEFPFKFTQWAHFRCFFPPRKSAAHKCI